MLKNYRHKVNEGFTDVFNTDLTDYSADYEKADKMYMMTDGINKKLEQAEQSYCDLKRYHNYKYTKWWNIKIVNDTAVIEGKGDAHLSSEEIHDNPPFSVALQPWLSFSSNWHYDFYSSHAKLVNYRGFPTSFDAKGQTGAYNVLDINFSHNKLSNLPEIKFDGSNADVIYINFSYNNLNDSDLDKFILYNIEKAEIDLRGNKNLSWKAVKTFIDRIGKEVKVVMPANLFNERLEDEKTLIDYNYIEKIQPIIDKEREEYLKNGATLEVITPTELKAIKKLIDPFVVQIGVHENKNFPDCARTIKFISTNNTNYEEGMVGVNPKAWQKPKPNEVCWNGMISKTARYNYGLCLTTNLGGNPMVNDAKDPKIYGNMKLKEFMEWFVEKHARERI